MAVSLRDVLLSFCVEGKWELVRGLTAPPPPASAMLPLLPNRVWGDYPLEVYVGLEIKPSMTEEW